jgi:glycosyltransferase involved in cell wall biosynthesis
MNSKIKVLHLTFDMRIGGTEQVIKNLIETTDTTKYDASILCIEQPIGPFGQLLIKSGINIDSFQRKNGFDLTLIKDIRRYIKQHKIDVLHCHQYSPWVYGTFATIFLNVKVIFTEHGRFYPDSGSWKRRLINPLLSFFTSNITAISEATKQALVEFEYLTSKKIMVVYNGISSQIPQFELVSSLREQYNINPSNVVFGTVARLDPIKNQTLLIKAFHQVLLQEPDCKLFIVGDGEEREKLEHLTAKLNITESVIFTGYITQPLNYMALMDVFVLPSLSEGTSMTLLEAMSLGKPCIVTNVGGNPEVIKGQYNGIVVGNQELEQLRDSMVTLAENKQMREELGKNGKALFNRKFFVKSMTSDYQKIYK